MAFTQIAVTGVYRLADGTPVDGTVSLTPTTAMRNVDGTSETTVAGTVEVGITAGALAALTLSATDDPDTTPVGVTYKVEERINRHRGVRTYYIEVPYDGGPIDLNTAPIVESIPRAITIPTPGPPGVQGPPGEQGPAGADGAGAVDSVNGQTGAVVLDATDVGAEAAHAVDVESFRSAGSDLATLQAAFAAVESGQTIRFGQGRTYTISTGFSAVWSNLTDVTVDFNGATIVAPEVDGAIFTITGEYWAAATTAAASIAERATTLTTVADVGLAAGDIITIRSSGEVFNPDRPTDYLKGELARVAAVAGTTVTLASPTLYSYSVTANTVTVGRITPVTRLTIVQPSVIGAGSGDAGTAQLGVYVRYFDDCTIVRPHVVSAKRTGVAGMTGFNFKVTGGAVEDCDEASLGYGIRALSVDGVTFAYNKGRRNRHTLDVDAFSPTSPFPCRNVFYFRNEAEDDSSAGISTHGGCDIATITHNITRNCGGGFVIRGAASTVTYNEVHGSKTHGENGQSYQHAYLIGDDTPHPFGLGLGGVDLVFEHNFADISNPRWVTDGDDSCGLYCTPRLVNARIAHNRLRGFSSHGMYFKGDGGTNAEFVGNDIDCSAQVAGNGILLDPANPGAGTAFVDVRIARGNRISDSTSAPVKIVGGVDAGHASTDITVIDNEYPGWASGDPADLTEGFFDEVTGGGGMVVSDGIRQIVQLTQAAYDLLTPDPTVMYVVVD